MESLPQSPELNEQSAREMSAMVAAFYMRLRQDDIPAEHCLILTSNWMVSAMGAAVTGSAVTDILKKLGGDDE